jgi:diaminohydroxyphosphoribosylaminopyrimidine deaminase/5-amino-6-(5-phosphoribosylamino)uracil reductase
MAGVQVTHREDQGDHGCSLWARDILASNLPHPETLHGDSRFMAMAILEGLGGVGLCSPNPAVGCVLVKGDEVIGRGGHQRAGGPHAEILALDDTRRRGLDPAGATAYVTLEPCCHQGRTPPCTEALIEARLSRVVVGTRDPNPRVSGGGILRLRQAGIRVSNCPLDGACFEAHRPFFKWIANSMPWVILLRAPNPRKKAHCQVRRVRDLLRQTADAVLTDVRSLSGMGLVLDDPWPSPVPPQRVFRKVLLDPHGRLPSTHSFWSSLPSQPVYRALAHAQVGMPGVEDVLYGDGGGDLGIPAVLGFLGQLGAVRVLVEGDDSLAGTFFKYGLADEIWDV